MIPVRIRAAPSLGGHQRKAITMATKKKAQHGSVKRFGPRYGRTLKQKTGKIEKKQKRTYQCPSCRYERVKQESTGIWTCGKCGAKFTSRAYSIAKLPSLQSGGEEED